MDKDMILQEKEAEVRDFRHLLKKKRVFHFGKYIER